LKTPNQDNEMWGKYKKKIMKIWNVSKINNVRTFLHISMSFFFPLGRASGEKCFLNPIGFGKFFECFPNHYAKGFVGVGENSTTIHLREI
jgi:hypothetical protein